jgi:hypothetical protein
MRYMLLKILFILSSCQFCLEKNAPGRVPRGCLGGREKSAFSRGGHVTWKGLSFLSFYLPFHVRSLRFAPAMSAWEKVVPVFNDNFFLALVPFFSPRFFASVFETDESKEGLKKKCKRGQDS